MDRLHAALAAVALTGAAGCRMPDSMTAVEHEQEAQRHRAEADSARATVTLAETAQPALSGYDSARDPGAGMMPYAAGRAAYDGREAERHDQAAARIRAEAETACLRVPPSTRARCPLPTGVRVEPLPNGARLVLSGDSESLRARITCALAETRVDRPPEGDRCPLLVPGAQVRFVESAALFAVEITGADLAVQGEIRARAGELQPAPNP